MHLDRSNVMQQGTCWPEQAEQQSNGHINYGQLCDGIILSRYFKDITRLPYSTLHTFLT